MSSFSRLVTLALGLSALGCGVLAYQQYSLLKNARESIDALEKERASLLDRIAQLEKTRAERPRWAPTASNSGPTVVADSASETTGGPVPARGDGGGFNRMRAMMESPQAQKFMAMQQKAGLDGRYAALFRKLNLSPADLDKFKDLLVERQTSAMDVMAAARNQGLDMRANSQEIAQLIHDAQSEVDISIQGVLGDTGYQSYQNYEQTLPMRNTVSQLEQRLSYTSTPLSSDQADQLARILTDTNPKQANDPRTAIAGAFSMGTAGPVAFFGGGTSINDDTIARAQGVLSTDQMDALKKMQQEQIARAQLSQEMRLNRAGAVPGASGGPIPMPVSPAPGGG